jgi:hypothetical protein
LQRGRIARRERLVSRRWPLEIIDDPLAEKTEKSVTPRDIPGRVARPSSVLPFRERYHEASFRLVPSVADCGARACIAFWNLDRKVNED